jgi:hypothetical protein
MTRRDRIWESRAGEEGGAGTANSSNRREEGCGRRRRREGARDWWPARQAVGGWWRAVLRGVGGALAEGGEDREFGWWRPGGPCCEVQAARGFRLRGCLDPFVT